MSAMWAGVQSCKLLAAKRIYDSCFERYDKKDPSEIYGELDFSRVCDRLSRETVRFRGKRAVLQGYIYTCKDAVGLVLVCHGMHAGADDYIPFIEYFVKNGFSVFAYDCTGTYASRGNSTVGIYTYVSDLDSALGYVERNSRLNQLPLFLFGHSCGGFAAAAILSIHKNIRACAAIAPFHDGLELVRAKGEQYVSHLPQIIQKSFPGGLIDLYQCFLFGRYTRLNATLGINSTEIPIFIAHGRNDEIISFDSQSVISKKDALREKNVHYYVGEGARSGHNSILHSTRAVEYQEKIKSALGALKKEKSRELTRGELADFSASVNHSLYSEVNGEMMDDIIAIFKGSLRREK